MVLLPGINMHLQWLHLIESQSATLYANTDNILRINGHCLVQRKESTICSIILKKVFKDEDTVSKVSDAFYISVPTSMTDLLLSGGEEKGFFFSFSYRYQNKMHRLDFLSRIFT